MADWNYRGFYIPTYPGVTLDSATLKVCVSGSPGTYSLKLIVRSNTFDGLILGISSSTVVLDGTVGHWVNAVFNYPALPMPKGSRACFSLAVISGPAGNVFYNVGGGCTEVIETEDTAPPLSTLRNNGVALTVTGTEGTVTPGWSIQAAINAAVPGETVFVGPGTYHENISLRSGINVIGSGYGSTFLVGTGATSVVTCTDVTNSRLAGFHISGSGTESSSAGVRLWGGNVMVDNNLITGNTNGVWIVAGASGIVRNNIIQSNGVPPASFDTYGIVCDNASPLIANNLIVGNRNVGIELYRSLASAAQVINNTIVANYYGIVCGSGANPTLKNNIVTGNRSGIAAWSGETPAILFNDAWGNTPIGDYVAVAPGLGGLSVDPVFDPTLPGSYYLAGTSPCIHAGDPAPAYNNPDGTRNTMGAYGGPTGLEQVFSSGVTSGFLFNSIGIIPTSEITQSGPSAGLANVSTNMANALHIERFEDAPFGGWVWLNGLFGSSDSAVHYYQIWAAPWSGSTPPDPTNFTPVLDPLTKVKYTIATNGTVVATPVNVGPDANGLYLRTDLPDSGYWAFPDLKLILNTVRLPNGRWDFICKAFATNDPSSGVILLSNQLSRITLWIDNNPVTTTIAAVRNAAGAVIPECGIINAINSQENLRFDITAYHPTGFLHSFWLSALYGRNHSGGNVTYETYAGAHDQPGTRPFWNGVPAGTETNAAPAFASGALASWQTCAYQFHLEAWARTINGFGRIYGSAFNDHYYINVAGTPSPCAGDLNNDGRVDGLDLAIFATRFGTNCSAPSPTALSIPTAAGAKP